MQVVIVRNVHSAIPETCHQLRLFGVDRGSRNGAVRMFPYPLTTCYGSPRERVVFWPERDANPFFHLFEALWMLAGRNDVDFPERFNSKFGQYSDDGRTFNAAYGHRWRRHFGRDQLKLIGAALRENPDCRRQVLGIWDPTHDLGLQSKDLPCNTQVYFQRDHKGSLDMMVTNRSNDLIWGAYGANAVHFSMLQEYMAGLIGCEVGHYWQTSMNSHLYLEPHGKLMEQMAQKAPMPPETRTCPYSLGQVAPFPLMSIPANRWDRELAAFLENPSGDFIDPFFESVAKPLYMAYTAFKDKRPDRFYQAKHHVRFCAATDWMLACMQWLERREMKEKINGPVS